MASFGVTTVTEESFNFVPLFMHFGPHWRCSGLIRDRLKRPYEVLGIEPELAAYKASTLRALHVLSNFDMT